MVEASTRVSSRRFPIASRSRRENQPHGRLAWARPLAIASLLAALTASAPASGHAANLVLGSRGPAVAELNSRLAHLRYLPRRQVSNRFARPTLFAVVAFQKYARLERDGIVGPATRAALRRATRPRPRSSRGGRRIEVALAQQLVFLVDGRGRVVRALSASTGRPGFATPTGSYRVYRRKARSWSYLYGVWLPWAAYFVRGYALHGARSVPAQPASHGCVRLPMPFAKAVYGFATRGTRLRVLR